MGYYTVYLAVISPCFLSQGKFCQEGHLLLSDRKSILMAQNLVRSSDHRQYVVIVNIVLLFKKDRQKNKVTKVKNVNAMNLLQKGQFL